MDNAVPEEGREPGEIFAYEIWEHILNNVTRTDDLINCYNTTPGWRKLLEPRRMTFIPELMSKVFQIVDDRVKFGYKDMLNLRRVSHSWKGTIDHFLQNHPHHFDIGFSSSRTLPDYFPPFPLFRTEFFCKISRFLEKVNAFPKADPFFGRTIRYHESSSSSASIHLSRFRGGNRRGPAIHAQGRTIPEQRNLFRNILSQFGERIWHAVFSFNLKKTDSEDFYLVVHSFLRLMPNLRSFIITVNDGLEDIHKVTPELKQLLTDLPLPPLQHLVFLGMRNVQEPVQSGMLLKYNQIRRFSFQNSTGFRPSFSPDTFPNLEFNSLEQLRTFNYCVEDIQMLQSKAGVWPLSHLNMRWIQVTDLPLVLHAISGFSNTIKHLQIEFRGVRAHEFEGLSEKLELPHLESLKITAVQSYLNVIDFLVPCGQLKKLEMEIWIPSFVTPSFDSPPQTIQFGGCASSMYNSNIWRLLPNLNKMLIRTVTNRPTRPEAPVHDWFLYSRSEYLELLEAPPPPPAAAEIDRQ